MEGAKLEVKTIGVRSSDGMLYFWPSLPTRRDVAKFKRVSQGDGKWQHVIRQMLKHRRPVRVRLIVGFRQDEEGRDVPVFDELVYRPIENLRAVTIVQPTTSQHTPLLPQRLE